MLPSSSCHLGGDWSRAIGWYLHSGMLGGLVLGMAWQKVWCSRDLGCARVRLLFLPPQHTFCWYCT